MNWSDEQLAIFEWFRNGTGHLEVKARAGTGKTTTIKAAFEYAPERKICYAVFNKKNQLEAERKIQDSRVDVTTLHSLGFKFIKRVWGNADPKNGTALERERAESVMTGASPEEIGLLVKLVSRLKNTTINPTYADASRVAEDQDIVLSGDAAQLALDVLALSKERDAQGRISFDDMVWLPVAMGWVRPWYDLVVVDEAQDMNTPQLEMARGAVKPSGRIVVVGDDRQAIYGFRGAVQNGMGMMKVTLRASTLTLTTTYRCPKSVVALAATLVPDYHAAPTAPEGSVSACNEAAMIAAVTPGKTAILSRLNAPLMPLALAILRKDIPARIEGRDIGRQLIGMVKSMKARSVPHFIERVEAWRSKQLERLAKAKDADKKREQVCDLAETLLALAQDSKSVADIEARITNLFQDTDANSKPAVVLSSVHKAKGLEWPDVYLLSGTFRASKGGEEANIYYVAVTRAQARLFLVGGSSPESAPTTSVMPSQEAPATVPAKVIPPPSRRREQSVPTKPEARRDEGEESYYLPDGLVRHQLGNVIVQDGAEYICTLVNACRARFTYIGRETKEIKGRFDDEAKQVTFTSRKHIDTSPNAEPTMIVRRLNELELQDYLGRKAGRAKDGRTSSNETDDSMGTKKEKKTSTSWVALTGSADFVRKLYDAGKTKTEAREAAAAKWPQFAVGAADASGFDSRWNTAERIAKNAKAKESTPAKSTAKAKTAPAKKAKSTAKAKATPTPTPKKKPTAAAAPAPAPRPTAPAPAPVAEQAPSESEPEGTEAEGEAA